MRIAGVVLLLALAGCGRTASDWSANQPGIDVAEAALRGGTPQVALDVVNGILARHPGNETALVLQGDALTGLGRFDDATASYRSALRQNSESAGAEVGLGRLQLGTDPAAAEALFLQALDHDPRNTTALNDLGVARDLQGHHTGAQEAYRRALGIDPHLSAAQVNLALSLAMSGQTGEAEHMLRPLAADPTATRKLRHDLAAVLTMAGQRDEAARILSVDLSPDEVRQALDAYASARSGGVQPVLAAPAPGTTTPTPLAPPTATAPPATAPAPHASSTAAPHASAAPPSHTAAPPSHTASATPPHAAATTAATATTAPHGTGTLPAARAARPADTALAAVAATATPLAAAAPAVKAPASASIQVQFAATPSEEVAQTVWQRLQELVPELLGARSPEFIKVDRDGHVFWRVRTGGFPDSETADAFCRQVRAAGGPCIVSGA
jgi:Flp pilus assembly protein TadD